MLAPIAKIAYTLSVLALATLGTMVTAYLASQGIGFMLSRVGNLMPMSPMFEYDGGYDHLEYHDYVHQVEEGEELPEGEYENKEIQLPQAVL